MQWKPTNRCITHRIIASVLLIVYNVFWKNHRVIHVVLQQYELLLAVSDNVFLYHSQSVKALYKIPPSTIIASHLERHNFLEYVLDSAEISIQIGLLLFASHR